MKNYLDRSILPAGTRLPKNLFGRQALAQVGPFSFLRQVQDGARSRTITSRCWVNKGLNNFVVTPANEYAYRSSRLFARPELPCYYNPLLIVGERGLGKSHLMQCLHQIFTRFRGIRINFTNGAQLVREYTRAFINNRLSLFRERQLDCDVFMLDDFHCLAGKKALHREFAHLFDTLNNAGKKIVLTSLYIPEPGADWPERLTSRVKSGLIVKLVNPDYQSRLDILKTLQLYHRRRINETILEYIARRLNTNLRDLVEVGEEVFFTTLPTEEKVRKIIDSITK